jgi:hypothetical protein
MSLPASPPGARAAHNPSWKTMARLLRVIDLLSKPGGTHTQEIASEIGLRNDRDVKRTVLEALAELGLRVVDLDEGKPGVAHRYRLDKEFVRTVRVGIPDPRKTLFEPVLAPDEWMLLSFLLNSGGRLCGRAEVQAVLQRLRSKLSAVLDDSSLNHHEQEFARLFDRLEPVFEYLGGSAKLYPDDIWESTVNPLAEAIVHQRICRLVYHSFHAETVKTMDVLPLRLIEREGSLYLLAMVDKYRNKVLPLEIGRIKSLEMLAATFDLPDVDLDGMLAGSFGVFIDEPRRYRIRFSEAVAKHIRERQWAAGQILHEEADGGLVLEMETAGFQDVKRWVLTWGADAEVLEPAELRAGLVASLRQALAAYGTHS